jgi:hypothetical protein
MTASVSLPLPKDEWKLKVNAQYQEAIKLLANLVAASLILPILFVKNFIGLKEGESIARYLNWQAYLLGSSFFVSGMRHGVLLVVRQVREGSLRR